MTITKAVGFLAEDGTMWPTLNEAAGHMYSKRLKDVLKPRGGSGVFGVNTVLAHSKEIAPILNEYNATLEDLDNAENGQTIEPFQPGQPDTQTA